MFLRPQQHGGARFHIQIHFQNVLRDIFAFEYVVNVYVMIEFDRLHSAVGRSHRNVTVVSVHRVVFAFHKFHAARS